MYVDHKVVSKKYCENKYPRSGVPSRLEYFLEGKK